MAELEEDKPTDAIPTLQPCVHCGLKIKLGLTTVSVGRNVTRLPLAEAAMRPRSFPEGMAASAFPIVDRQDNWGRKPGRSPLQDLEWVGKTAATQEETIYAPLCDV